MKFRQQHVKGVSCNCSLFPTAGLIRKIQTKEQKNAQKHTFSKTNSKLSLKQTQLPKYSQHVKNIRPQKISSQNKSFEVNKNNKEILQDNKQRGKRRQSLLLLQRNFIEKNTQILQVDSQKQVNSHSEIPLLLCEKKSSKKKSINHFKQVISISQKKQIVNKLTKLSQGHFKLQTVKELQMPVLNNQQSKKSFTTMTCSHLKLVRQRINYNVDENNKNQINVVAEVILQENHKRAKIKNQCILLSDMLCRQAQSLLGEDELLNDNQFSIVLNQGNRNINLQCTLNQSLELEDIKDLNYS